MRFFKHLGLQAALAMRAGPCPICHPFALFLLCFTPYSYRLSLCRGAVLVCALLLPGRLIY
jgi:hypothetical protein